MGIRAWLNKWKSQRRSRHVENVEKIAHVEPQVAPELASPPGPPSISVTTVEQPEFVEDSTHNNEPYEYKRDQGDARESSPISISTNAAESPLSALGVLKPPPSVTEAASDVAPSSIRSFGKRDSPNLKAVEEAVTQEIPSLPQDSSAIGGQFDDSQAGEPPDFEEIQSQTLENQLWDAQIEWPKGQNRYFIPADEQLRLIKTESIITELRRCMVPLAREQLLKTADQIFEDAPRLFAILVYMSKSECILSFLDEGFSDDDLPFIRAELKCNGIGTGSFKLRSRRHPTRRIKCMDSWGRNAITSFDRDQWWMLAPIFKYKDGKRSKEKVRHWDLEDNCVLPLVDDQELKATDGGFSSVWGVLVHPAHQHLYKSKNPKVANPWLAFKKLNSTERKDFDTEVETLKQFSNHRHPHLIKLLATFRLKGRYHLVFPHADANLRGYWEKTPLPELSETTLRWSLTQCKGIASGLMAIHEYRTSLGEVTNSPTTPPSHARRFSYNLSPNPLPAENERRYGRHGDIKPENILWTELTDEDDPQGILLIADFGLVDFHGKQTRSQILPETVNGSPSYEPPERRLNIKISRAYDIWSLGCVYLEFITWLVSGWEDLSKFPIVRGKTGSIGINDDTFFTILDERSTRTAIVRESVAEWIKDLHEKPRCSKFIHDFLDLVEKDMLVVDTSMRIQCGPLNKRLRQMLEEAEKDPSYLTAPKPTPKRERNDIAQEITKRMTWGYRDTPPAGPTEGSALPTRELPLILDTVAVSRVSSQRSSRRSSSPLPHASHDVEETALARPQRASTPLPTFSFPDD